MPTNEELERIAAKVMADPNTAKIAEQLGVPLEEYVQSVVTFIADPKAEPEFVTISDENLKKMGAPPPSIEEMTAYVQGLVDQKMARAKSTFEEAPTGGRVALTPDVAPQKALTPEEEELQRRVKQGGKV